MYVLNTGQIRARMIGDIINDHDFSFKMLIRNENTVVRKQTVNAFHQMMIIILSQMINFQFSAITLVW